MKKVVIHQPGGYQQLAIEQHPDLHPGPNDIVVSVLASGVNFADCVTRMGLYSSAKHYVGYPITPGFEVSGTVLECGAGVTDLEPGTAVIAVTRFNLGRAQWEAGQRELGRRNVSEAERELIAIGEMGEEDLAAVREWLAEH